MLSCLVQLQLKNGLSNLYQMIYLWVNCNAIWHVDNKLFNLIQCTSIAFWLKINGSCKNQTCCFTTWNKIWQRHLITECGATSFLPPFLACPKILQRAPNLALTLRPFSVFSMSTFFSCREQFWLGGGSVDHRIYWAWPNHLWQHSEILGCAISLGKLHYILGN